MGSSLYSWSGIYVSTVYGIPLLPETIPADADLKSLVNKEYVDLAVTSLGASYYMWDVDDPAGYKTCYLEPSSDSETYIEVSNLVDDQYIAGWISAEGEAPNKLLKGVYDWFITMEKTTGTKTLRVYWKLYERLSDGTEIEVATSSESNEIDERKTYLVPLQLDTDYIPSEGSRIVGKIYARVTGSGNAPTIRIYYQGNTSSRWEIPANSEIFQNIFVPYENAKKDVDLGSHTITTTGYANVGSLQIGGTEIVTSGRILQNIASVGQSLLPTSDGAYDLGSSSLRWREIRAKGGYINDVVIDDYNRLRGAIITGDTLTGKFNWIDLNDLGYFADKRYTVTVTPSPISGSISYMFQNHARYSYAKFDSSPVTIEIDLGGAVHYWRGCMIYVTKGAGDNVDEIKVECYDTRDGLWYEYASATNTTTLIHFPGASRNYVGKWRITITATLDTGEDIRVRMIRLFNFYIITGRLQSFPFVSIRGGYIFGELVPYPDGSVDLGTPTYRWANIHAMKVKHYTDCVLPTSAPPSPEAGSMYFDTSTNKLYVYNGSAWVSVTLS